MTHYDFAERVAFSEGIDCDEGMRRHLIRSIPGAYDMQKATKSEDRNGTDFWIHRYELQPLSVDFKHRSFCPIERFGRDDACIETCSVYKGQGRPPYEDERRLKPGWTINSAKNTDLVVYTWPFGKERRYWVLFFPHLCEASRRHRVEWVKTYGERPTPNLGYFTLNTYVPRKVIAEAMRELVSGVA